MRRLVLLDTARNDLLDVFNYVTRESGDRTIARRFVNSILEKCANLATLPGTLGRARPELRHDIRSFALRNYVIFFRYQDKVFEVVNVLEGHRDIVSYYAEKGE